MTARHLHGTRALVLGAGGFIGANLAEALVAAGADVTGFGHRPHFAEAAREVRWIDGDFATDVATAVPGHHLVFHLLGTSNPAAASADPVETVGPNQALLDACRATGVAKLIFVSSGGTVYGPGAPLPTPETAPTAPIAAYGAAKLTVEKLLERYADLDPAVLRVANPYGRYQRADRGQGLIAKLIDHAQRDEPVEIWGDGEVVRDFLHVDDVVAALLHASAPTVGERVFNVGSGTGRSLNSVIDDVGAVLGKPVEIIRRAGRPADIPASILDISRAERVLGWRPQVDWRDGLSRTAEWLAAR